MRPARKLLTLGFGLAALALAAVPAYADNGNSSNTRACQQNGWQSWVRSDQAAFASFAECVSYAARGGTLTQPANGGGAGDGL